MSSARADALAGMPGVFAMPSSQPLRLAVAPRLASWNAAGHPDQVRLDAFLTAAEHLLVPRLECLAGPLALRLDVGLPPATRLLDQYDLDNYLFPLAVRLSGQPGRHFVSVWGTKRHAPASFIRVEQASPAQGTLPAAFTGTVVTDRSSQSSAFKEQIHDQLADATTLPDGPVTLQLSFTVGPRKNWLNLWKPTIDALDQILGRSSPERSWHPRDGRVVALGLHRRVNP